MIFMYLTFIGFMFMISNLGYSQLNALSGNINNLMKDFSGEYSLYFEDVKDSNLKFALNENEYFHAASTMKTPVMLEVLKQAEEGKFKLDDSIKVINKFKSIVDGSEYSLDMADDSGEDLYSEIDSYKTIKELIVDMITNSGNLSTNILINLVSAASVMTTIKEHNISSLNVLRGVQDLKAFDAGLNNTLTATSLGKLFLLIAKKQYVSEAVCDKAIEILLMQNHKSVIPKLLPNEIKVANKTGSITGVNHDSGIIYLPNGESYVLVILGKNIEDKKSGVDKQAQLSKLIFDKYIEMKK